MADLRAHPDIQAEADRRATEGRAACIAAIERHHTGEARDALVAGVSPLWVFQEAHLEMPLNDPDICARLLAARVGIVVGATAPGWRRFRLGLPNGSESWAWALLGTPGEQFFFTDGNAPGISAILDPLPALHAALAATEPRTP